MRVLVTGGTGFIGSAVTTALLRDGHEVVALVRDTSRPLTAGVTARPGDMTRPETYAPLVADVDAVIHAAQLSAGGRLTRGRARAVFAADRLMTRTLAEACLTHGRRLIYTGGCFDWGDHGHDWIDEDTPRHPHRQAPATPNKRPGWTSGIGRRGSTSASAVAPGPAGRRGRDSQHRVRTRPLSRAYEGARAAACDCQRSMIRSSVLQVRPGAAGSVDPLPPVERVLLDAVDDPVDDFDVSVAVLPLPRDHAVVGVSVTAVPDAPVEPGGPVGGLDVSRRGIHGDTGRRGISRCSLSRYGSRGETHSNCRGHHAEFHGTQFSHSYSLDLDTSGSPNGGPRLSLSTLDNPSGDLLYQFGEVVWRK